jgi:NTP pyrophosphatase (non-canonical NTP hydrolase)
MDFNEYQKFTESMAVYNTSIDLHGKFVAGDESFDIAVPMPYTYPILAIAEEAGEVCGKVAKFVRKSKQGVDVEALRMDIGKELGDVLFQVSEAARMFGFTLEEIAIINKVKLEDRKARDVLVGEGDNR